MAGPLSGVSYLATFSLVHKHCQDQSRCHGPGCCATTGKTRRTKAKGRR